VIRNYSIVLTTGSTILAFATVAAQIAGSLLDGHFLCSIQHKPLGPEVKTSVTGSFTSSMKEATRRRANS
jgi:hypothetical protein